jgi:hypothetical protein
VISICLLLLIIEHIYILVQTTFVAGLLRPLLQPLRFISYLFTAFSISLRPLVVIDSGRTPGDSSCLERELLSVTLVRFTAGCGVDTSLIFCLLAATIVGASPLPSLLARFTRLVDGFDLISLRYSAWVFCLSAAGLCFAAFAAFSAR